MSSVFNSASRGVFVITVLPLLTSTASLLALEQGFPSLQTITSQGFLATPAATATLPQSCGRFALDIAEIVDGRVVVAQSGGETRGAGTDWGGSRGIIEGGLEIGRPARVLGGLGGADGVDGLLSTPVLDGACGVGGLIGAHGCDGGALEWMMDWTLACNGTMRAFESGQTTVLQFKER